MNVKIKRLNENAVIPKYAREGDAGFDLVATEDVIIEPGETKLIPTGLAFEIPAGYEMQIRPRSGISAKTKLRVANAPGTIDAGYRGEVKVIIDNIAQKEYDLATMTIGNGVGQMLYEQSDYRVLTIGDGIYETDGEYPINTYIIRKGERIAQGIIKPVEQATFIEVDELSETCRGDGGFGSSGVTSKEGE